MTDETQGDVEIGDVDPEDEWDDEDALRLKLAILERVIEALKERRDERVEARKADALRLVVKVVREVDDARVRLERIRTALEAI